MEDSVAYTKVEVLRADLVSHIMTAQDGVLVYKVNEDLMDPLVFWLTEEWASSRDLVNHCSSTNYAGIAAR